MVLAYLVPTGTRARDGAVGPGNSIGTEIFSTSYRMVAVGQPEPNKQIAAETWRARWKKVSIGLRLHGKAA